MTPEQRIEQYLNRATRGLWGKKRQKVKQELYSHIYEKMHFQMSFGKSESDALEQALQSLGNPGEVNSGLLKTHAFPGALKSLLIAGVLGSLVISQAQNLKTIEVFQKTPPCMSSNLCFPASHYIRLTDLQPLLAQLNIAVEFKTEGVLQKTPQLYLNGENIHLSSSNLLGDSPDNAHVDISDVLFGIYLNKGVRISGLLNPEIELQSTRIKFENKTTPYDATDFYRSLIQQEVQDLTQTTLLVMNDDYSKVPSKRITVRIPEAQDGEIYALIQKPDAEIYNAQGKPLKAASLVLGEARNGQVELYANYNDLQPVSLKDLEKGDVFLKLSGDPSQPKYTEIFPSTDDITRHF